MNDGRLTTRPPARPPRRDPRAGVARPSAQVVGVVDLSAPVLGPDGDAAAVLTCAYVLHPGDDARTDRAGALAMLRETAAALSFTG